MPGVALRIGFVDRKNRLRGMERAIAYALAGGLNDGGRKVFTVIRRQLRTQTRPKKYATITSRTWALSASAGALRYEMRAKDEPIDLSEFGAAATAEGIRAAPWGVARVFARSFQQPRRAGKGNALGLVARIGDKRYPIRPLHGPNLAREFMGLTPGSRVPEEFMRAAALFVPPAILARLSRALG